MKKINLLFDASYIVEGLSANNYSRSGIYFVADNLLKQFLSCSIYNVKILIPPSNFLLKFHILKHFHNLFNYLILEPNNKKFLSKIKNFDIIFSPMYGFLNALNNISTITVYQILYDCIPSIFKDLYPFLDSEHWYTKLIKSLNKDTNYFCISECTRKDFINLFSEKLDKDKMFITPLASSKNLTPLYNINNIYKLVNKYNPKLNQNFNYIFSLCTIEPRKNLIFTVNCFIEFIKKYNIDNLYYFIGGGHFSGYFEQFKQAISNFSEYQDKIIILGYIDDNDLNYFYSNSLFFIYLSQYEGFGLPTLEAMQSGTPVICSNNSSFPEVVGDAAITIPYNDKALCINAMENLYFNKAVRDNYIAKGLKRSKLFSWDKTFSLINEIFMKNISREKY